MRLRVFKIPCGSLHLWVTFLAETSKDLEIILITTVLSFTFCVLNCNPKIPWERTVGHVNNMMRCMQYSGYSKRFRYEIVQSALHAYKKMQELDQTGVKPMHRPKEWRQNERRKR